MAKYYNPKELLKYIKNDKYLTFIITPKNYGKSVHEKKRRKK